MVRNYKRKTNRGAAYSKEQLKAAVNDVATGKMGLKKASSLYKIPRSTLRDHVKGRRGMKSGTLGRCSDIAFKEEKKIAEGIKTMEKWGFGLSRSEVLENVAHFVKQNKIKTQFKDGYPGADWFINFRKRHRLSIKKPQMVEVARKKSLDPFVIYKYFDLLKTTIDQLDLADKPSHIWNLDESSFCTDPTKTKIVGQIGFPCTRTTSGPGRENTSVLLACSAAGDKGAALVVFKGKDVYDEWTAPEIPDGPKLVYAATKKGWMEREVFENYFKKVLVKDFGERRPILLIYDGHSTHLGINLIEEAIKEGITILKLPPHSSHLLQPLDLAVFKSLKDKWDSKLVHWQRQHPGKKIIKKTFSTLIQEVWNDANPCIIQNGFKKGGIYPYNQNVIQRHSFDPLAFRRWAEYIGRSTHITGDNTSITDPPTTEEELDISQPSTSTAQEKAFFQPSTSTVQEKAKVPFEEILLATLKPKASSQELEKKPKKRVAGGAEIITREEVLQRLKEREQSNTRKIKKKKSQEPVVSSDSEVDDIIYDEDDEYETLEQFADYEEQLQKEQFHYERQISKKAVGDWILVKFAGKKSIKYYVGQVLDENNMVKFARKKKLLNNKSVFKFPDIDDISEVYDNDITMLLPTPVIERRGEISFQVSFAGYDLQ